MSAPRGRTAAAAWAVWIGSVAVMLVVLGRVAVLQAAPSEALSSFVSDRALRRGEPAIRGDLLDRHGRVLATSRLAWRLILDPVGIVEAVASGRLGSAHELVVPLARAAGVDPDELGVALIESGAAGGEPPRSRYTPVGEPVGVTGADRVRALGLPGVWLEPWPVRELVGGEHVAPVVGMVGFEKRGLTGAELAYDDALSGDEGWVRYSRDARGRPLWIRRGDSRWATRGADVRLSIDAHAQLVATEELRRGIEDADAAGGRLMAVDPWTGEVLAMVDLLREVPSAVPFPWIDPAARAATETPPPAAPVRYLTLGDDPLRRAHPSLGRNRCVTDLYEPGSTFKSLVWAGALELGVLPEGETVLTGQRAYRTPYGRSINDVTKRPELDWAGVLVHSSNIGMSIAADRMTPGQLRGIVRSLGFGAATGLGLPGERSGTVTTAAAWGDYTQTSVSFGHEIAVTPAQMARAYAALARTGSLAGTMPRLRALAATAEEVRASGVDRVFSARTAARTRGVLVEVVERMDATTRRRFEDEPPPGYRLFGKSGTAEIPLAPPWVVDSEGVRQRRLERPRWAGGYFDRQYNSSFIAAGPVGEPGDESVPPRLVVIVVIDDPGPSLVRRREHYGSWVAGPVARRFMERTLRAMGVGTQLGGETALGG